MYKYIYQVQRLLIESILNHRIYTYVFNCTRTETSLVHDSLKCKLMDPVMDFSVLYN